MANLLLPERPLIVLPSLAKALNSVDKAIMLQQLNFWLSRSGHEHDGKMWVYNTISSWADQFPWLSVKTVQRYLHDLERRGLVLTANYNRYKFDRTKWYSIDYETVEKLAGRLGQSDQNERDSQSPRKGIVNPHPRGFASLTDTIDYTKTTTKSTSSLSPSAGQQLSTDHQKSTSDGSTGETDKQTTNPFNDLSSDEATAVRLAQHSFNQWNYGEHQLSKHELKQLRSAIRGRPTVIVGRLVNKALSLASEDPFHYFLTLLKNEPEESA